MLRNKRILAHLLFWVFHLVSGFFAWDYQNYQEGHFAEFTTIIVSSHFTTLLYFYINYAVLVPRLLLKKKYFTYAVAIFLSTALFSLSKAYIWNSFTFIDGFLISYQRSGLVFTIIFFYCISTAFKMFDYWQQSENQKNALLQEVKDTELLYLKSQMSPHFLFNTLNNIYGLSLKDSPQTSLSISQLKDLMLYIEAFETGEKISIGQEIHYLKSFVALHQLRYVSTVRFNIEEHQTHEVFIEPMIFLPFIENAFKHGSVEPESLITISFSIHDTAIHFQIINGIALQKRKDKVGGIGIKNVQRRLELQYPKSFTLATGIVHSNQFNVDLLLKTA